MSSEESRWTYTLGSRPEGCIIYDDDTKFHSHHDTDPARGQSSAFDLVRLHRFGHLDAAVRGDTQITDRPSYHAMVEFAQSLSEIRAGRAAGEFEDLGELPAGPLPAGEVANDAASSPSRFTVVAASEFSSGAPLEWLVRHVLPRAELAVVFGESGVGKSFVVIDVCAAITRGIEWRENRVSQGRVVYVCAEGSRGFKKRLRAYAHEHQVELGKSFAILADTPNLLEPKDAAAIVDAIKKYFSTKVAASDSTSEGDIS